MPKKRSKKNPLSASDKTKNRAISSERVPCENVIAMLKRFKIIADRYRNRRRRFGLRFPHRRNLQHGTRRRMTVMQEVY
jgi:DDE superfamily endonuclease